jgi:hypothetical protein
MTAQEFFGTYGRGLKVMFGPREKGPTPEQGRGSSGQEFFDSIFGSYVGALKRRDAAQAEGVARSGAAAGAATGTQGSVIDKLKAAGEQIAKPAPVPAGEAMKQTALSAVGLGPIAGDLRSFWVWAIIVIVGLIGVWGLIAPGGGVAVIERLKK